MSSNCQTVEQERYRSLVTTILYTFDCSVFPYQFQIDGKVDSFKIFQAVSPKKKNAAILNKI